MRRERSENGDYSFTASDDGTFRYCFSNVCSSIFMLATQTNFEQEFDHSGTKEISFNVHGIVYVPYTEHDADPLEREVRTLAELLQQVKDEQEYIKIRERVHRNSTLSTTPILFLGGWH